MRQLLVLLSAVLGTACARHAPRSTAHLFPDEATVIGHRGARDLAPENTLSSFAVAAETHGRPFELDVHLCATGEPVVIHDETLERTTDGTGFVDETPLSALQALDAGRHFGPDFAGEPLPTLRQVLDRFGHQVVIDIELKNPRDPAQVEPLAQAVVAELAATGLTERVLITSFNPYLLEAVRKAEPRIARGQLTGSFHDSDLSFIEKLVLRKLWLDGKAQADVVAVEAAHLTERSVRRWRRKGFRVLAWTVNDPEEMGRLLDWGVQGLITDRPDVALQVLEQRNAR